MTGFFSRGDRKRCQHADLERIAGARGRANRIGAPNAWRLQRGQSSMEYAVVCAALALALGIGMLDDASALWQLLDAFRTAYANISFSMSLPT